MAFDRTPKPGEGVLFPTKEKRSEKSPDMGGHVFAHKDLKKGDRIAISAWNKTSQKGESFISLSAKDPWVPKTDPAPKRQGDDGPRGGEFTDDIPF